MSIPKSPGDTMTHNLLFLLDDTIPGEEEEEDMDGDGTPPQAVT